MVSGWGCVISLALCCVCRIVDDLISKLQNLNYGCWMSNLYIGFILFADDILLISPTINGLQRQLNICASFSDERFIIFNDKKSVCLQFGLNCSSIKFNLVLCNKELSWVDSIKYLGFVIVGGNRFVIVEFYLLTFGVQFFHLIVSVDTCSPLSLLDAALHCTVCQCYCTFCVFSVALVVK